MIAPIPPVGASGVSPTDFQLPGVEDVTGPAQAGDTHGGFGAMLEKALGNLTQAQTDAAQQSQQLAAGKATDVSSVVMSVEKASLEVQLASQIRNKLVEDYQDIFRMQV